MMMTLMRFDGTPLHSLTPVLIFHTYRRRRRTATLNAAAFAIIANEHIRRALKAVAMSAMPQCLIYRCIIRPPFRSVRMSSVPCRRYFALDMMITAQRAGLLCRIS